MRDRLFTVSQLAGHWGWSVGKIMRLVKAGEIPHVRLGRRHNAIHFRESALETWLRDRNVPMASRPSTDAVITREEQCRRLGIPVDHEFS